jgi:hypothetical protein
MLPSRNKDEVVKASILVTRRVKAHARLSLVFSVMKLARASHCCSLNQFRIFAHADLRFAWTEFVRKYVNAKVAASSRDVSPSTLEKQRNRRDGTVLSGQSVALFAKYDLCSAVAPLDPVRQKQLRRSLLPMSNVRE